MNSSFMSRVFPHVAAFVKVSNCTLRRGFVQVYLVATIATELFADSLKIVPVGVTCYHVQYSSSDHHYPGQRGHYCENNILFLSTKI